ncbi:MAG: anti-sigma factor family protein [Planctomycetota bacterium]|jgi:hypothetical protein
MISDELRELLSAYVDGELPHGEAARVEESAKRDPRLRRHINSYRRLAETLRMWDVEEHAHQPSDQLTERALARVRSYESERRHEVGPAPIIWWQRPTALAAGVLLALGLGILAAMSGSKQESTTTWARSDGLAMSEVAIGGDYRSTADGVTLKPLAFDPPVYPTDTFTSVIRHETVGIPYELDGETIYPRNRRTREALESIRRLKDDLRRSPEKPNLRETRTGTQPNAFLASVLKEYDPHTTGFERLVALRHKLDAAAVPAMRPAPERTDDASRYVQGGMLDTAHYLRVTKNGAPVLTLAGELWVEPQGKGERVGISRVVTATTWVKSGELVKMAWATSKRADPKANQFALRAESLVLGPKARRMLLGRSGHDAELIAQFADLYGQSGAIAAGRVGTKANRAVVSKLVAALEADRAATGFAVYGERGWRTRATARHRDLRHARAHDAVRAAPAAWLPAGGGRSRATQAGQRGRAKVHRAGARVPQSRTPAQRATRRRSAHLEGRRGLAGGHAPGQPGLADPPDRRPRALSRGRAGSPDAVRGIAGKMGR